LQIAEATRAKPGGRLQRWQRRSTLAQLDDQRDRKSKAAIIRTVPLSTAACWTT